MRDIIEILGLAIAMFVAFYGMCMCMCYGGLNGIEIVFGMEIKDQWTASFWLACPVAGTLSFLYRKSD